MILAGDIGGTKTNLALCDKEGSIVHLETYPSQHYADLQTIVQEFIRGCEPLCPTPINRGCFAIAGPVVENVCQTTNLPWIVDANVLSRNLGIEKVCLLNDLEANAWALAILPPESYELLHPGRALQGNRAVISPGTGLGEAALYWDGVYHHPFACEGGHCELGPRNELQIDLCRYLYQKFTHASYERALSGPGLYNIYQFYKEVRHSVEPDWLREKIEKSDPAKVITEEALNQTSELCIETLNLFVSLLGAEAGNCALKFMAIGGIYLGGGIPPKILPKLKESIFFEAFIDKGRFRSLLENIPIYVILDDKASLKGAAHFCFHPGFFHSTTS